MSQISLWLKRGLILIGALLLFPVVLIAILVCSILFWPLSLVVASICILAAVLYVMSPSFRSRLDAKIDEQMQYKGLRLISGTDFHPSHSWARILLWHVLVGADDLVQAVLGPVQAVDLPAVGTRVKEGDPLFTLRRGNRSVAVRAPISGIVIARNEQLLKHPALVNNEPFHRGWAVRLRPENASQDRRRLLHGEEARTWFGREIDRLMTSLHADEVLTTCLADGGTVAHDLYQHIDDDAWNRLSETFFTSETTA